MEGWTRTYAARRARAVAEPMTWTFDAEGHGELFTVAPRPPPVPTRPHLVINTYLVNLIILLCHSVVTSSSRIR